MAGDGWTSTTVGALIERNGGSVKTGPFGTTLKANEYSTEGVPLISVGEIGYGSLTVRESTPRAPKEVVERLPEYVLEADDIVFGRKGAVDRSALIKPEQSGWFLGSDGIRLRLPKACDARFIAYHFRSAATRTWLLQHATGTTMASLNQGTIERVPIVLPPIAEQRTIAYILGTLDDKIDLNRRMNETLEAMARALFKSWFVDFDPIYAKAEGRDPGMPKTLADLFPDSFEDSELGEIPKWWDVKQLSGLCTLGRGASPRPINDYMNGEVPWVKIADATAAGGPFLFETKERLKTTGVNKSVSVCPGDLILSNSATCGVPMFVELHGCIHDGWLYFKNLHSISKLYLFHVLIELAGHLVHIADGSVQKNLNTELVGRQYVLVPSQAVVAAFDKQTTTWFARMRNNGIEGRTLAALRDTMLPKLISGELRVTAAERFVSEAA